MAANKTIRFGPVAIPNAVGNLFNPPTLTGGVGVPGTATYVILKHLRIVNKTAGAVTVSAYIGLTGGSAAGTEFGWNGFSIPANSRDDWYGAVRLDTADFLTAVASAAASLTIEGEGEIGVA